MGEHIWPESAMTWITLAACFVMLARIFYEAFRAVMSTAKLERECARMWKLHADMLHDLGIDVRSHEKQLVTIREYFERQVSQPSPKRWDATTDRFVRDRVVATGFMRNTIEIPALQPQDRVIANFLDSVITNAITNATPPAPAADPDESAPKATEEQDDTDRVRDHQAELAEWDKEFGRPIS